MTGGVMHTARPNGRLERKPIWLACFARLESTPYSFELINRTPSGWPDSLKLASDADYMGN